MALPTISKLAKLPNIRSGISADLVSALEYFKVTFNGLHGWFHLLSFLN
jgi:hypothetical protein